MGELCVVDEGEEKKRRKEKGRLKKKNINKTKKKKKNEVFFYTFKLSFFGDEWAPVGDFRFWH